MVESGGEKSNPLKRTNLEPMPTLQHLESALLETPNLSELAISKGNDAADKLQSETSDHLSCDKTTLGELARALQVETHWNGRTYSLSIENGANRVILQTPVIVTAK